MTEETTNGINSTDAKRWVGEIEKLDAEAEAYRAELRERREGLFTRAEEAGLPIASLKLEVWRRAQDRKRKRKEEAAGTDRVDLADMIREVLGDFADSPLGGAAVKAAVDSSPPKKRGRKPKGGAPLVGEDTGAAPKTGDDDDDLRGTRQLEKEALRKAETEERLSGMKTHEEGARPN